MSGYRPIGVLGAVLGQAEGFLPCVSPDGRSGLKVEGGPCVPFDPPPPLPPPRTQPGPTDPSLPPGFVAPGPTELHPERWDLDACLYTIAWGDTYVGLAKTYLDPSGERWREIWNLNRAQHPNPDQIGVGQVIKMTEEACDNMRRWVDRGKPGGTLPSGVGPPTVGDRARAWAPALLAAAAAAGLYWMS